MLFSWTQEVKLNWIYKLSRSSFRKCIGASVFVSVQVLTQIHTSVCISVSEYTSSLQDGVIGLEWIMERKSSLTLLCLWGSWCCAKAPITAETFSVQDNWSILLPHFTGSAESDLYICVWAQMSRRNKSQRELQVCEWKVDVCVCVWFFVRRAQMKLGHSLQLSRAEDELATEVG